MVWMCEARMRVNGYAKQAEYFTEDVVNIFGLDKDTAAIVALNALENTLSRLIASLTAELLEQRRDHDAEAVLEVVCPQRRQHIFVFMCCACTPGHAVSCVALVSLFACCVCMILRR